MGFFKNLFKKKAAPQIPEEVAEKVAQHFDEGVMPEECRVRPFSARSYARYLEALRVREITQQKTLLAKRNQEDLNNVYFLAGSGVCDQQASQNNRGLLQSGKTTAQSEDFVLPFILAAAAIGPCMPDDTLTGQGGSFDGAGASGDWDSSTTGSTE